LGALVIPNGSVVGIDTAPLMYYVENHPAYADRVHPIFAAAERNELRFVTSSLTLTEVLVHPIRQGRDDLIRAYHEILVEDPNLKTLPLTNQIAEQAARLRAAYRLKTPDAIQLATAIVGGASWFLTNDSELPSPPGLTLLVLDRLPA
jgi:predicted nucleic acid-binding protein